MTAGVLSTVEEMNQRALQASNCLKVPDTSTRHLKKLSGAQEKVHPSMRSNDTISLFSERPLSSQRPTSFLISILAHGATIALVALGVLLNPRIDTRIMTARYTMRHLDLHMPDPVVRRAANKGMHYPGPKAETPTPPGDKSPSARPEVARQVAQLTPAPQTLVQPKLAPKVLEEKIPIPTAVIWQTETNPLTAIVPPVPQKPVQSMVRPSVSPPNEEINMADVAIKSSEMPTLPQPILPSTSSPLVVLAPDAPQAPPQTTSVSNSPPTPAAVVSLSDLRPDGTVMLPQVNESASSTSSGILAPGRPEDLSKADGSAEGKGTGAAHDPAKSGDGKQQGSAPGSNASATPSAGTDSGSSNSQTVARITLPKEGQYGVVVVGTSLEEVYPETAELWSGRLAYTVYLHVGMKKSWILQYALPAADDAASSGSATHLAAPWPYTIIRPNLAPGDFNADALMVHGIVDKAGHFETLAVAFPPRFPLSDFVLQSLRQWEFRPATRDGHAAAVEVLLIIPDEEPE